MVVNAGEQDGRGLIPVVVLVPPEPAPSPASTAVLVDSCTEGLGRGECRVGPELGSDESHVVTVRIRSEGEGKGALLSAEPVGRGETEPTTARLSFDPTDPETERYRTIGFLAASLSLEYSPFVDSEEAASGPNVESSTATSGLDFELGVGGLVGSGSREAPRWGGLLRTALVSRGGGLLGVLEFSYSKAPRHRELALGFLGAKAGLGYRLPFSKAWSGESSVNFLLTRLDAVAHGPLETAASGARWMTGATLGATLLFCPGSWGGFVSGELLRFSRGTTVEVESEPRATVSPWNYSFSSGAFVRF